MRISTNMINNMKLPLVAVLALVLSATPSLACGGGCDHDPRSPTNTDIVKTPTGNTDIDMTNSTLITLDKRQDIRCGVGLPGCPNNMCCSRAGFCGHSQFHCGAHCQVLRGRCDIDSIRAIHRPHFRPQGRGQPIFDCTQPNAIALTWDDGPSEHTGPLLDLLRQEGVKATFFVNGQHRERNGFDTRTGIWPDVVRRIVREGHQLASHTWGHLLNLNSESEESRNQQVMWNEIMFRDILGGYFPTYMRPPHGNCEGHCLTQIGNLGYTAVIWNLDTKDWAVQPPHQSANEVWKAMDKYSAELWDQSRSSYGKTISLTHDTLGGTLALARHMISQAKARGLTFLTVGECLGDWDRANWYRDAKTGERRRP